LPLATEGTQETRLSFAEREQARPKVKGAQVYGIDISEESVAKAKKVNVNVLDKQVFVTLGSAEKLPYEDGKFDLVTAVETVYFWPNLPNFRFFQPSCGLFFVSLQRDWEM